ncbi:MAG: hypothetical protein ACJ8C4_00755 [Gemmataceae bacterium]
MMLAALDRPDDPKALAGWLESQLAGTGLRDLAAELAAIHGAAASERTTAAQWLGPARDEVLQRGLGSLPAGTLGELMKRPALLLKLQEEILVHGGPYWQQLLDRRGEYNRAEERGREQLREMSAPATIAPRRTSHRREWMVAFATAAAVLLAVWGINKVTAPSDDNWGWTRADAFAQADTAKGYLNRLADEADEWFKKSPTDAKGLAKRLGQMREGCSALLLSDHTVLAAADRDWLRERCRAWSARFDGQIAALERGDDPKKVKDEADETIRKLDKALRERAATV